MKLRIVSASVGGISESDVQLAQSVDATIIGFNVRASTAVVREVRQGVHDQPGRRAVQAFWAYWEETENI